MTKYNSIDILKFIASFFVVIIHISLFYDVNPYLNLFTAQGLARLAVPLYFLASSLFFYKKNSTLDYMSQKKALIKYTTRMAILYLGWFIITLPKTIYEHFIYNGNSISVNLFKFIKSFFFTSTFSGSWFLVSCIFSVWLLFFICNKLGDKANTTILIVSVFCYFLCTITSAYGNVFCNLGLGNFYENLVFYFTKPYTSILVGVPYFALGRYIAQKDPHLTCFEKILLCCFLVLFFLEIIITYKFGLQQSSDCYLMLLPTTYLLFVLIKDIKVELKFNPIILRNTSTIIFFSHFIWIFVIEIFEKALTISINSVMRFFIVSFLSLLTSVIFIKLSKYKMFSWLGYLY